MKASKPLAQIPFIKCPTCNRVPFVYLYTKSELIYECKPCNIINKISLSDLIDEEEFEKYNPKISKNCEKCNTQSDTIKYCIICNKCFCKKCAKEHDSANKNHLYNSLYINTSQKCRVHNSTINAYCKKCNKELCSHCVKEKECTEHTEHLNDVILLETLIDSNKISAIKQNYTNIQKEYYRIAIEVKENLINEINNEIFKANGKYQRHVEIIENEHNKKIEQYNQQIEKINKLIEEESEEKLSLINNESKILADVVNSLEAKLTKIEKAYSTNKEDNELIMKYFEIIMDNYNTCNGQSNFNSIQNLLLNGKFNNKTYEDYLFIHNNNLKTNENDNSIQNELLFKYTHLLNYFNSYFIIEPKNPFKFQVDSVDLGLDINEDNFDSYSSMIKSNNESKYNNKIVFCPKCYAIPLINIYSKSDLILFCQNCGYKSKLLISNFVKMIDNYKYNINMDNTNDCVNLNNHSKRFSSKQCLMCNNYLCNQCIKNHNKSNNSHVIVENFLNISLKCKIHNELITKYCESCNEDLCEKCISSNGKKHSDHANSIVNFSKMLNEEKMNDIQNNLVKARNQIDVINVELRDKFIEEKKQQKKNIIENVNKEYENIRNETYSNIQNYHDNIQELFEMVQDEYEKLDMLTSNYQQQKFDLLNQCETDINIIKETFNFNQNYNNNLFKLLSVLISNYTYYQGSNVYQCIFNIVNNTKFNFISFEDFSHMNKDDVLIVVPRNKCKSLMDRYNETNQNFHLLRSYFSDNFIINFNEKSFLDNTEESITIHHNEFKKASSVCVTGNSQNNDFKNKSAIDLAPKTGYDFGCDFLEFNQNPKMWKTLIKESDEMILFSDRITEIATINKARNFVITNKHIYRLNKFEIKYKGDIKNIIGFTTTKDTEDFIIHCAELEDDFTYSSPNKKKIFEIIGKFYFVETLKELKICIVEPKSLSKYVTDKNTKKKKLNSCKMDEDKSMLIRNYLYGINTFKTIHDDIKFNLNEFTIKKVIGRGAVGKIYLVEYIRNKKIYALKSIRKDQIISQKIFENILLEKKILNDVKCPFINNLILSFQNNNRIYFLLYLALRGDLYHYLYNDQYKLQQLLIKEGISPNKVDEKFISKIQHQAENDIFKRLDEDDIINLKDLLTKLDKKKLTEEHIKFIAVQLLLAIHYLHSKCVIYRDLKPENILICMDGYVNLCDFSSCVISENTDEKIFEKAGGIYYMSPEMLLDEGYNYSTDFWSLGVLLYEMYFNKNPFYNNNKNKSIENIKFGELKFPSNVPISEEFKDVLIRFIERDPTRRLGANGFNEIKNHKFFNNINFDDVLKKKIDPPKLHFNDLNMTVVSAEDCVNNVDDVFLEMDLNESPVEKWIDNYQESFKEFDTSEGYY